MPLLDDLALPLADEEVRRRRVLGWIGTCALGAAALGTAVTAYKFFQPNVLFEEDTRFGVGRPEEIAPGTVLVLPKQKVYVVRTDEGFYAVSSVCTHLGCMTRYDRERACFACPCHGSRFRLDGRVEAGPAPRALQRLHLSIERGVLVVDAGRRAPDNAVLKVT